MMKFGSAIRVALLLLLSSTAGCVGLKKTPGTCFDRICDDPSQYCDFDGALEGQPNTCIEVTCSPGDFATCRADDTAAICNATGDNLDIQTCDLGCDPGLGCNTCTPNTVTCDGDILRTCDASGALTNETCSASCVSSPAPHCAHIVPRYLPDVCDTPAVDPELVISSSGTFDTSLDTSCNGGVVAQLGGPEICVVRYGSIAISAGSELRVIGRPVDVLDGGRAVAFVADNDITIGGVLDIAGRTTGTLDPPPASGPGGGFTTSGTGGGAGFATFGADGGTPTTDGGAMNGGTAALDPITNAILVGGPRSRGGGGGGGMTLVACRGVVRLTGTIDAGGGGGLGGFVFPMFGITSGGGGGAGGYVVLQGLAVNVEGEVYANGGGGGGGRIPSSTFGAPGKNGTRSESCAAGGTAGMGEGSGGSGGCVTTPVFPRPGTRSIAAGTTPGGGGGSVGFFQSYTPALEAATLAPAKSSPRFQPPATIPTR